jgi:hypothetical protein
MLICAVFDSMFVQVKCRKTMEIKKVFGQIFEYLLCTNVC